MTDAEKELLDRLEARAVVLARALTMLHELLEASTFAMEHPGIESAQALLVKMQASVEFLAEHAR